MKIRLLPPYPGSVYEAHVWHKNGDHPEDRSETLTDSEGQPFLSEGKVVRRYRRPDVPGDQLCELCGCTMDEHGWIDQSAPSFEGHHYHDTASNPFHAFFAPMDNRVCPGGMVVTNGATAPGYYNSISPKDFERVFEVVRG